MWRELIRTAGLMRRVSEPHFARMGLSGAHWGVLRALFRLERRGVERPRMHEVRAELLVQPPSLSATLDRMVRAGLVTTAPDERDRRSRRVTMSPRGRGLLADEIDGHRAWLSDVSSALGPEEQARLEALLRKLSSRLSALADGAAPGVGGAGTRRAPLTPHARRWS